MYKKIFFDLFGDRRDLILGEIVSALTLSFFAGALILGKMVYSLTLLIRGWSLAHIN